MKRIFRIGAALLAMTLTPAAAAQERIDRPGTTLHRPADAHFPERVGEFRRANVYQYGEAGDNLSATYNLVRPDGRMVLTVYIYPAARIAAAPGSGRTAESARALSCASEFDQVREIIRAQYRDAELAEDGAAPAVDGVEPALGRRSVFRMVVPFDGSERAVRSEVDLYCYVGGAWLVKYRATSHAGFDARPAIEEFIRTGPWPGRAAPPAPEDIAAAALPASPS